MKLIVTGDWHIKRERLSECENILFQIKKYIDVNDGIIILGDIFDNERPTPDEIYLFIDFIRNIPLSKSIYVIEGNHGKERLGIHSTMWLPKICSTNLSYNLHIINIANKTIRLEHCNVSESKLGPSDIQISGASYKNFKEDILLLGHIHKSQIISEIPLVVHPGSPYYINFGERNDKKGIGILTIEDKIKYEFIPLKTIPMIQIEVSEKKFQEIEDKLEEIPENAKVKLLISLNNYSLENTEKIKNIINKIKQKTDKFCYDIKIKPKKIELQKIKQETTESLFTTFCKKEKVDNEIKKLLRGMLK